MGDKPLIQRKEKKFSGENPIIVKVRIRLTTARTNPVVVKYSPRGSIVPRFIFGKSFIAITMAMTAVIWQQNPKQLRTKMEMPRCLSV